MKKRAALTQMNQANLLTVKLLQFRHHMRDTVGQSCGHSLGPDKDLSRKKILPRIQAFAPTGCYVSDEMGMNPLLHGLEPVDVLRPFRSKGIRSIP